MAFAREVTSCGLGHRRFSGISTWLRPMCRNRQSLDSVDTVTRKLPGRVFYGLPTIRRLERYMQYLDSNKPRRGNGRFVAFFNANSSQAGHLIQATRSYRVQESPSPTFALSLGALRVSGGLLEFLWDADHQTLEGASDTAVRMVTPISKNHRKKEAPLCLLVLWNANRKLAK